MTTPRAGSRPPGLKKRKPGARPACEAKFRPWTGLRSCASSGPGTESDIPFPLARPGGYRLRGGLLRKGRAGSRPRLPGRNRAHNPADPPPAGSLGANLAQPSQVPDAPIPIRSSLLHRGRLRRHLRGHGPSAAPGRLVETNILNPPARIRLVRHLDLGGIFRGLPRLENHRVGGGARPPLPVSPWATAGRRLHGVRPRSDRSLRCAPRPLPGSAMATGRHPQKRSRLPEAADLKPPSEQCKGAGRGSDRADLSRSGPTPCIRLPAVAATRPGGRAEPPPRARSPTAVFPIPRPRARPGSVYPGESACVPASQAGPSYGSRPPPADAALPPAPRSLRGIPAHLRRPLRGMLIDLRPDHFEIVMEILPRSGGLGLRFSLTLISLPGIES